MNDLSLRISNGAKKPKNIMSLAPAVIVNLPDDVAKNENVKPFLQAATASEQLAELNELLRFDAEENVIHLLAIVYFHSEAKHPVKCFLTRHITKNKQLQEPFINLLSSEILLCMKDEHSSYKSYRDTVTKVGMCLESFPAGTTAVEVVALTLAPYLNSCFQCCLDTVRSMNLSPTEKSVVYSLAHLTLRILLHIITKIQPKLNCNNHTVLCKSLHKNMRGSLDEFLMDAEMPMDTKSVCGLVVLALDAYKYNDAPNPDAWRNFVYEKQNGLMSEEAQLAMLSAIITTVPMAALQKKENSDELTPVEIILQKLMDIVERCSSDGVVILGVARTLCRLSKALGQLEPARGARVAQQLLAFVWSHLEHYMDSVRHQAAQLLADTVQYCAQLEIDGSDVTALPAALGAMRRGWHAGLRGLARLLPAQRLLAATPPPRLLAALLLPDLASTVSYTLEDLLTRHSREVGAEEIYEQWVLPILAFVRSNDLEPQTLTTLEKLLDKAVLLNQDLFSYILPHIKQACSSQEEDLKNVLVLLSVARPSLVKLNMTSQDERWGGVLSYEVLKDAVVDARDQVRVTGLGLACKGGARVPARGELRVLRHYLAYCDREPPHARQLARPALAKFVKRLFDAKRAATRNGDNPQESEFNQFIEDLRHDCYSGLSRGASLARRATSLELLLELETPACSTWKVEYVETLLMHLDDSYETNKRHAVELLCRAPVHILEELANSSPILQVEDIIKSASSLRPADCATAVVRLEVLVKRLPHLLPPTPGCRPARQEGVSLALRRVLAALAPEYAPLRAPRDAPTYGLLQAADSLLHILDPEAIVGDPVWDELVERSVRACRRLLAGAGAVVAAAAPEGALPLEPYTDYGNDKGVILEDGRQVTAQMVLLCAWRTVKEATGVLGTIGARLCLPSIGAEGLCALAELLAGVLADARHRGAFEQAYVAFERVVARMWRCPEPAVSSWPRAQLAARLQQLREPSKAQRALRRGAGLPFLLQALVSTEPCSGGPGGAGGGSLREVLLTLLDRAGDPHAEADDRALACNVLRALYRDSSLDSAVQSYVGDGLRVALMGFEGATWTERNASTLLLSALVTRVFGVARARARLASRNRMTGRVFFLRYPQLYDIMLNKLKEANESEEKLLLCPSLYPVLLLLGRLYPSSLEGTESNLKLVSFVPLVVSLARARGEHTRRLAAAAAAPLIAPHRYVPHLQQLFLLVSEPRVEMNFCHGVLLQILALLDLKPEGVTCEDLRSSIPGVLWLVAEPQLRRPCWPCLHQLALLLLRLADRFPETSEPATQAALHGPLRRLLLRSPSKPDNTRQLPISPDNTRELPISADNTRQLPISPDSGRAVAIAPLLQLLLTIEPDDISDVINHALVNDEICEAVLEYLLARLDCLPSLAESVPKLAELLPRVAEPLRMEIFWKTQPQRAYKHLEFLVAVGDTQELLISPHCPHSPDDVIRELANLTLAARDSVSHLYLDSLTSYVIPRLPQLSIQSLSVYVAALLQGGRGGGAAGAAATLRAHGLQLLARLQGEDAFPAYSGVWACLCALVRAGQPAAAALQLARHSSRHSVVSARASSLLLEAAADAALAASLLTALALCGCAPPDDTEVDETRIFEPREKEIAIAEEMQWTATCADQLVQLCSRDGTDPLTRVADTLGRWHLPYLDRDTVTTVKKLLAGENVPASPVVQLFVRKLKGEV